MKSIGNWKAWQSKDGRVKRIYISDSAYLYEGATGLYSGCGVSVAEAEFIFARYGRMQFSELFGIVSNAEKTIKADRKAKKAKNKLYREICDKYGTVEERDRALKSAGF